MASAAEAETGAIFINGLLAVEENCTGLCFRGGIHDGADGLKFVDYWTIRGCSWVNVV